MLRSGYFGRRSQRHPYFFCRCLRDENFFSHAVVLNTVLIWIPWRSFFGSVLRNGIHWGRLQEFYFLSVALRSSGHMTDNDGNVQSIPYCWKMNALAAHVSKSLSKDTSATTLVKGSRLLSATSNMRHASHLFRFPAQHCKNLDG